MRTDKEAEKDSKDKKNLLNIPSSDLKKNQSLRPH